MAHIARDSRGMGKGKGKRIDGTGYTKGKKDGGKFGGYKGGASGK